MLPDAASSSSVDFSHASSSSSSSSLSSSGREPRLSGRFLHVTDFHPDRYYKPGSAVSAGCHSKKPKKDKDRAGYWGTPISGCDSPLHLVEESLDWVRRNWLPEQPQSGEEDARAPFDFIVWTGDSARHDIDNKYPRTRQEIYDTNRWALSLLEEAFPGTPIVPTIGNNDIFPHNIMWPGPNDVISAFTDIWADIVPEYELHTFQLGGYFGREVIPNKLAVLSLNTLYWYDSNKVVDGCKKSKEKRQRKKKRKGKKGKRDSFAEGEEQEEDDEDEEQMPMTANDIFRALKTSDPGTVQLAWLEAQLYQYRKRGMHVHLLGHVPPTFGNYFQDCYDVYSDIVLHYQETVIAQHFGHMNVDGFFIQEDTEAVKKERRKQKKRKGRVMDEDDAWAAEDEEQDQIVKERSDNPLSTLINTEALSDDLRKDYSLVKTEAKTNESYYNYFFIAPSIIPTFLPGARIWTYNTSGIELDLSTSTRVQEVETPSEAEEGSDDEDYADEGSEEIYGSAVRNQFVFPPQEDSVFSDNDTARLEDPFIALRRNHRRPKHGGGRGKTTPLARYASPESPSRQNGPLSLLGYSQWVLDLDAANRAWEQENGHGKVMTEEEELAKRKGKLNFHLEYATYTPEVLWGDLIGSGDVRDGQHRHVPVPRHLLEDELKRRGLGIRDLVAEGNEIGANNTLAISRHRGLKVPDSLRAFTDWSLDAITIPNMLHLARRLAKNDKLWRRYERRMYEESGAI